MKLTRVEIKPLSVNEAWKGRRFKTNAYKRYVRDLMRILPNSVKVPDGKVKLYIRFGFSNNASDFDNPVKTTTDCLQKRYQFDDKVIRRAVIDIVDGVPKGQEYFEFALLPWDTPIQA